MLKGVALKVVSTLVFAGMVALVKNYSALYPIPEIVFFRAFFALGVLFVWLALRGEFPRALHTRWFSGHLLRSFAGCCSLVLGFSSYSLLPLAEATAIGFAGPLFIVILAGLILHERIGVARWGAIGLGSTGVLFMLWERLGQGDGTPQGVLGAFCAIGNAFTVAVAMIQTRRLILTETMGSVVFYFQSIASGLALGLTLAGLVWPGQGAFADFMRAQAWVTPAARDWPPLIAAGLLGGAGQILMTWSYKYADASIIACFEYTSMLWALAFGALIFGEAPTAAVLAGAAIVVAAGMVVIASERKRRSA